MSRSVHIALIGDHDPGIKAHLAIPKALALAAAAENLEVREKWFATEALDSNVEKQLGEFDGIWCVPGSPYKSMDGALNGIRFAREQRRPFLGTCGGFQHALIEFARNVLGWSEADHAESNPNASLPLISRLACSLSESEGKITLKAPSLVRTAYGRDEIHESYNCNFGLNPAHQSSLEKNGLRITGLDDRGGVRVIELEGHPFFIATLFQPERSAFRQVSHPLVVAFIKASARILA